MKVVDQCEADTALVNRALSHTLHNGEPEAFEQMRESLAEGMPLSAKERSWVKRAIDRNEPQYENLVSSGRVPIKPCSRLFDFEMMPRPLKPPHRRAER